MSDDIPRTRREQADASVPEAGEVPAGGGGADTGAVGSARIDDAEVADVPNISSQNDIAGVGTRAADGSMEAGTDLPPRSAAHGTRDQPEQAGTPAPTPPVAGSATSLAEEYEPGVDPAHARDSRAAGPAARRNDPRSPDDRPRDPAGRLAEKTGSRGLLLLAAIVGVIAVVMFAIAIPVAPAIAWIGIALEVALLALLTVSALALRGGHYRRLSMLVPTLAVVGVAVVVTVLLLIIGLAR